MATQKVLQNSKLHFGSIFKLRCLYCDRSSLLEPGSWFKFKEGCHECNYRYEREPGYFTGASWMVCFPLTSLLAFLIVICMMAFTNLEIVWIMAVGGFFSLIFGFYCMPYTMLVWMYFDHKISPLTIKDRLYES